MSLCSKYVAPCYIIGCCILRYIIRCRVHAQTPCLRVLYILHIRCYVHHTLYFGVQVYLTLYHWTLYTALYHRPTPYPTVLYTLCYIGYYVLHPALHFWVANIPHAYTILCCILCYTAQDPARNARPVGPMTDS
jgi:hypothetical protein